MYEELVMRLRKRAVNLKEKFSRNAELLSELMQAADAIEELSKLVSAIPHRCECCVGCELEQTEGECDNGFILSLTRALAYIEAVQ